MTDNNGMTPRLFTLRRPVAVLGALCTLAVLIAGMVAVLSRKPGTDAARPSARPTPTIAPTAAGAAIAMTKQVSGLDVTLRFSTADLGPTRVFVALRNRGHGVNHANVQVRLDMPAFPSLGVATARLAPVAGGYGGSGSFVALGRWRAVLRIQAPGQGAVTEARFDLLVGPGAGFVALAPLHARYGPATVTYASAADGSGIVRIHLRPGLRVRYIFAMPSMPEMGRTAFPMDAQAHGWYDGQIVFGMAGVTAITIEVLDHGIWRPARQLLFDAGSTDQGVLFASSPIVP